MLEHIFTDMLKDRLQPQNLNEMGHEVVAGFIEQFRLWMADGSHSPFSSIIRMMTYCKGYRRKEGGVARVMWEADGSALRYLGHRVVINDFRIAARAVIAESAGLLDKLMF